MFNLLRKFPATRRCASIISSFLFLTFLVSIQPHRVHHFFEHLSPPHSNKVVAAGDGEHDHDEDAPEQTHCVIQSAAQNAHLSQVQLVQMPCVQSAFETTNAEPTQRIQRFFFHPFLSRAPPADALFS
jgi:hypothetical protein